MAYDEGLAERVRGIIADEPGFKEKKMFGGLCFLLSGNMAWVITKIMAEGRVEPADY